MSGPPSHSVTVMPGGMLPHMPRLPVHASRRRFTDSTNVLTEGPCISASRQAELIDWQYVHGLKNAHRVVNIGLSMRRRTIRVVRMEALARATFGLYSSFSCESAVILRFPAPCSSIKSWQGNNDVVLYSSGPLDWAD